MRRREGALTSVLDKPKGTGRASTYDRVDVAEIFLTDSFEAAFG
jgi:hypothetical protein